MAYQLLELGLELQFRDISIITLDIPGRSPGHIMELYFLWGNGSVCFKETVSGDDPRLQRPPYSDHCVQYIVHRHVIRIAQSYHNVHRIGTQ